MISQQGTARPLTTVKLTLRAKGFLAFMALVTYVAIAGLILTHERSKLLRIALEVEHAYAEESALAKAGYAVAHATLKWQEKFFSARLPEAFEEQVALDVELIEAGIQGLMHGYPKILEDVDKLNEDVTGLRRDRSISNLIALRDHGREMSQHLEQAARQARAQKDKLWTEYRAVYDTMSVIAVIMGLLGAVFFGVTMTLFLTRMAWDLRKLAARTLEIVSGYRGPPVRVTRHDEIGLLMEAVNSMQSEMRRWEQQVEISRQQRFHKEKMAAIGSLASAVAHEINNPIAAIAGIAESLKESGRPAPDGESGIDPCDLILEQAKRITTISRQIAELTAPQPPEQELLDLNALVRNTCSFIGYDSRFRRIEMKLELDSQIPAISVVADHMTQVLMNLLINAADALDEIPGRKPKIVVKTQTAEGGVVMTVTDNGNGMDAQVLAQAFEESYTTKPPDKGRGLGLFLCKSLIEGGGNRIELESTPGVGTTARIRLALEPDEEPEQP